MPDNVAVAVIRNTTKTLELAINQDDGTPFDLTGSLITFEVKAIASDAAPALFTKQSVSSSEIEVGVPATLGTAKIHILAGDTSSLSIQQYVYRVKVDTPEPATLVAIDWSTFEITDGIAFNPPVFTNTVMVNHDFGSPDAFTYRTSGGSPIQDAQIRCYYKPDFDAGNTDTPLAITLTNSFGQWVSPMYLFPGFTYTLQFFKVGVFGPDKVEFTI